MKIITVEELHHLQSEVLRWVEAGEDVAIYREDRLIARLTPPPPPPQPAKFGAGKTFWEMSAASRRDKSEWKTLTQEETDAILHASSGFADDILLGHYEP